jgi:hypothetical protein
MAPDAIEKTSFTAQNGHYEFQRLPFGLSNAPADYNRIMNEIFNEFKDFEEHYFDDSTVHTNDLDQHIDHLEAIFTKLRQVNLKLNFDKCLFVQKEIKLFGHLIGNNCIKMDHKKVELIKNWPVPTNTSE